jgi:predicted nucleic acid-binding protein
MAQREKRSLSWRGSARQGGLARLLALCEVESMDEEQARRVGPLAGRAAHEDIVDVIVVEGAIRRGDAVVTSDEHHIRRIAEAARVRLRIERV